MNLLPHNLTNIQTHQNFFLGCLYVWIYGFVLVGCKAPITTEQLDQITTPENEGHPRDTNTALLNIVDLYDIKWTHAHEDDQGSIRYYYNSENLDFPPSRFRHTMILNKDATCQFMALSPSDRHHMAEGNYTVSNDTLAIFQPDGSLYKSYHIFAIVQDTLTLIHITL